MTALHRSLSLCAALFVAFGGTEACTSGSSGGGSKTDWLSCAVDADCPGAARCVARRCLSPAEAGIPSSDSGRTGGRGTGGARATGGDSAASGAAGAGSGGADGKGGSDAGLPPGGGGRDASLADASPASGGGPGDASRAPDANARSSDASHVTSSLDAGTAMQSCLPGGDGLTNCGAAQESCCTSLAVPGGTFFRTYTNNGSGPVGEADPATISAFRLDKYDVTTGRFRRFVAAWNGGWRPAAGSGKHASLSGGRGLVDEATTSGFEPGWAAADEAHVVPTNDQLDCQPGRSAWTPSPGAHETLPMNCVNWWEAYAFCIWDGGFLPTQAEWEYAAAGGSEQRQYSWGSTPPGTSNQYAIYDCHYGPFDAGASLPLDACAYQATLANVAPVGSAPLGAGAFGQLDLIGNVLTWALDTRPSPFGPSFSNPCVDCAYLPDASGTTERTISGGIFGANGLPLSPWVRIYVSAPTTYDDLGFRCARAPE